MKTFLAIDPGKTGAIAAFDGGRLTEVQGVAELRTMIEAYQFLCGDIGAVLEKVGGIPGQSAPAAFNFGRVYGEIRGVLGAFNIPIVDVMPQGWKGALDLYRKEGETTAQLKTRSRAMAAELFPHMAAHFARAKDDGKAEAALIGHWYLTKGPGK